MVAFRLLGLALVLSAAHAAFLAPTFLTPTVRSFHPGLSVDNWKRDDAESSKQCPEFVQIRAYRKTKSPYVYLVQHRDMLHDFVECTGKDYMAMIDVAALQNISKLVGADLEIQRAARLNLIKDGEFMSRAGSLTGPGGRVFALIELGPRLCGKTQFDEGTRGFFVTAKKGQIKPFELDPFKNPLNPGQKYMVMYEAGVGGRRCFFKMKVGTPPYPRPTNEGNVSIPIETAEPEPTPTPEEEAADPPRRNQGSGNVFGEIDTNSTKESGNAFDGSNLNSTEEIGSGFGGSSPNFTTPSGPSALKTIVNSCFPGSALVRLSAGAMIPISRLQIGDRVAVGGGAFSDVFMFTHRDADVRAHFVRLETASGAEIRLTAGHYLYVNGRLRAAEAVRVGDVLRGADGMPVLVTRIDSVEGVGLFNPQTAHGDIVVDGVTTSTYTRAVAPGAAHALLAPVRALFGLGGFSSLALDKGAGRFGALAPRGRVAL